MCWTGGLGPFFWCEQVLCQPRCCASVCQTQVRVRNHLIRDQKLLFSFLDVFFFFSSFGSKKDEFKSEAASPANAMGTQIISLS